MIFQNMVFNPKTLLPSQNNPKDHNGFQSHKEVGTF